MTEKIDPLNMALRTISIRLLQPSEEEAAIYAADYINRLFAVDCKIDNRPIDLGFAYVPERKQYQSTAILKRLKETLPDGIFALLAIVEGDLFVPGNNFVFGEAEIDGKVSIISLSRLRPEGETNSEKFNERVIKEAVHELGHVLGLRHCRNNRCVMSFSPSLKEVDMKTNRYCPDCCQTLAEKLRTD